MFSLLTVSLCFTLDRRKQVQLSMAIENGEHMQECSLAIVHGNIKIEIRKCNRGSRNEVEIECGKKYNGHKQVVLSQASHFAASCHAIGKK